MMSATVVHNQNDEYDVYIGREVPEFELAGSKWGQSIRPGRRER